MPRRYPLPALVTLVLAWLCVAFTVPVLVIFPIAFMVIGSQGLYVWAGRLFSYADHVAYCLSVGATPYSYMQYVGLPFLSFQLPWFFARDAISIVLWPALALAFLMAFVVYRAETISRRETMKLAVWLACAPLILLGITGPSGFVVGLESTVLLVLNLPAGALAAHAILRRLGMP